MNGTDEIGLVTLASRHSVAETLRQLLDLLESKGVHVFAVVDHSGEAERAGLHMPDTKLVIFGNPAAGTPIMLATPSAAIDLPLKLLIREETQAGGPTQVLVTYNSPEYLARRHGIAAALMPAVKAIEGLAQALTA